MSNKTAYLLVNFGGPRDLEEIRPFLSELLTDRDVVRTNLPDFIHRFLFRRVAQKRSLTIRTDYERIGGKSPIYFDTEAIKNLLADKLSAQVIAFHRYLPATHRDVIREIEALNVDEIRVLPLFPQFSYATTGSIARLLSKLLCCKTLNKLRWIQSYSGHRAFVSAYQKRIGDFLQEKQLVEKDIILLFSSHGLPQSFICTGDIYEAECRLSYNLVREMFKQAVCRLSYQSKFGKGQWLRPYTDESCKSVASWSEGRKKAVVVPLSFTSDHIETLYEIEHLYLPMLEEQGIEAYRCPALNREPYWIDALVEIANTPFLSSTAMLVRNPAVVFCCKQGGK